MFEKIKKYYDAGVWSADRQSIALLRNNPDGESVSLINQISTTRDSA